MKYVKGGFVLLYMVCAVSAFSEEKVFVLGGNAGWDAVEYREGLGEFEGIRPWTVLALSSAAREAASPSLEADLTLSFDQGFHDESGRYLVRAQAEALGKRWARLGSGAAFLRGTGDGITVEAHNGEALFAPDRDIGNFSIEFWMQGQQLENGEQILSWTAAGQSINCAIAKNRLQWSFTNFFRAPGSGAESAFRLTGLSALIPKQWSHHLIRFDAGTGLLEYLVNGRAEAMLYTTASGHEGSQVFIPRTNRGFFTLGSRFSGMLDEVRIYGSRLEQAETGKYGQLPGRFESRVFDIGQKNSLVYRVEAAGGRTRGGGKAVRNVYEGLLHNPSLADDSAIRFFIRSGEDAFTLRREAWLPFKPGADFPLDVRGRFVQVAADLYPSGDREGSPYIEELVLACVVNDPPRPPSQLAVTAHDGAVELSWKASADRDTAGYLVYFGTARGEYFGSGLLHKEGVTSPVDAGNVTRIRLEGLKNGTLYYFAVAAYDTAGLWEAPVMGDPRTALHAGEFSRELSARPLEGLSPRVLTQTSSPLALNND